MSLMIRFSSSPTSNHFQNRTLVDDGGNLTYKDNNNILYVYLLQHWSTQFRIFAFISATYK